MAFFHCHQKAPEFLVLISKSSKDLNFCHIYDLWLTGNRTLCHPIQSVIILVVKQIRLLLHGCLILLPWTTCLIQTELDFTQPYHHYKIQCFCFNMRSWSCTFGYEFTIQTSDPGLTPCYLGFFPFWGKEGETHNSSFWYENKGGGWAPSTISLDAPLTHQR